MGTAGEVRRALAAQAEGSLAAARALLGHWAWASRLDLVERLLGALEVPDTPDARRLGAWVWGEAPAGAPEGPELARDLFILERAGDGVADARPRATALYWLARLGEEHRRREVLAPAEHRWRADPAADRAAARVWAGLLQGPDVAAGQAFQRRFGAAVARAVTGVALSLGLPPSVAADHGERAREQADLMGILAAPDIAARVLEGAGEPLSALLGAFDPAQRGKVEGCVQRGGRWRAAREVVASEPSVALASEWLLANRLLDQLTRRGAAPLHPSGLPGWALVRANRARMRGRLRAVAAERPAALLAALSGLGGLAARTEGAVSRHAWDWAWREARVGFGLDLDRLRAPPCVVPPPGEPAPPPLDEDAHPLVRTWLLLVAGRGCWGELGAWLGGGGRTPGATFYRCLALAPDALADPGGPGPRARSYERLRTHLQDGGLEGHLDALREVAARVAALPDGRALKDALAGALAGAWCEDAIPLPQRGLGRLRDGIASLRTK